MLKWILVILCLLLYTPTISQAAETLQSRIDAAPKGATIEIEDGVYEEALVLSKPITLVGKGEVLLRTCEEKPVVAISGESVTLKNMKVEHCGDEKEDTAIYVTGSNHLLSDIRIDTRRYGIKLDQANDVAIIDSEILGRKAGKRD